MKGGFGPLSFHRIRENKMNIANVPVDGHTETGEIAGNTEQVHTPEPEGGVTFLNTREFEDKLKADLDSYSAWRWSEPYRTRLGAAAIGGDCERALFFAHRHVKATVTDGQKARLFQRGHREEPFGIELLRGIGFTVHDKDESGNQYGFQQFGGHYAGRADAVIIAPERYNLSGPILWSCKTAGTGQPFNKWNDDPVIKINPLYWAQEQALGFEMGIQYALWMVTNKNDDSIQPRIEELKPEEGKKFREKAHRVIFLYDENRTIPKAAGKAITAKVCQLCNFKTVCHESALSDKNCRSCHNCRPQSVSTNDGKPAWFCDKHDAQIPADILPNGCHEYSPLLSNFTQE
jgi:hypothetical protein